jgi:hypothetical protein
MKGEGQMFFSEEKNQKTFIPALYPGFRPCPERWGALKNKSLLLLFFRKEVLPCCFVRATERAT